MRLSYKWLSRYVDLEGITPEKLADEMTNAGLEVEGIEPMAQGTGLVIGEVVECEDVEGTHLHKAQVKVHENPDQIYQIICGAPNCRKGLKVIAALPGARLPGGVIEAKPLHGIESNGMLCALFELGVDKKYLTEKQCSGIEELPADAPVGETDVLKYIGYDDTILDVSLTPNRADCSAMWNMAKEVGAICHRKVTWPDYEGLSDGGTKPAFQVKTTAKGCEFYSGKAVNHVKVGPSPKWMADCLHAAGMNSINNVVDISNFVMLETGQPLHYYDISKLPHKEFTVVDDRDLDMTALDGVSFHIQKGDLLITTGGEATGVAGIMGGEESMIDENTKGIFIEAAHFDHASIRHTSTRLNLMTEAAQRFTKGIEPTAWKKAMDRSIQLLKEYAEADDIEETVTDGNDGYKPLAVTETLEHCNGLLGTDFKLDEVVEVLKWLDFRPEVNGTAITCHIPSYRIDIEGKADIDEEVIRLLGYDSLGSTLPQITATVGQLSDVQKKRRTTREVMRSQGLNEIVTYTLVGRDYIDNAFLPQGDAIALAMPMSEARKYIRTSMINSVLECVQYNEAHSNTGNHFYEISRIYTAKGDEERLAVVLDGAMKEDKLHHIEEPADFYAMKGILLAWLEKLGFKEPRVKVAENRTDLVHFHPYRSAELWLDRTKIGVFGEIHPEYAQKFDLKHIVYAEVKLNPVFDAKAGRVKFEALNNYPAVSRDIALVVDQSVNGGAIEDVIHKTGKKLIKDAEIFDVYEGEHVGEGRKSIALHIVYQAADHTLKDDEVSTVHNAILEALSKELKAELRG